MPARHRARPAARARAAGPGLAAVVGAGSALTVAITAVVAVGAPAAPPLPAERAVALAVATPAEVPAQAPAAAPAVPWPRGAPYPAPVLPAAPEAPEAPEPTEPLAASSAAEPAPAAPDATTTGTTTTEDASATDAGDGTDTARTSLRILALLEEVRALLEAQGTAGVPDDAEAPEDRGTGAPVPAPPAADTPPPVEDAAPAAEGVPEPAGASAGGDGEDPFAAGRPYVDPDTDAAAAAASADDPAEREALQQLADEGSATWVGGWSGDPATAVREVVDEARATATTPTFVLYDVPGRDCGSYSAGGAAGPDAYRRWVQGVAQGLAGAGAVVVLEPDALAGMDCLAPEAQAERLDLLAGAAAELDAAGATVYVDAGTPGWQPVEVMAERLEAVGVDRVRGFALNVSNYQSTADNEAYGDALVAALGGGAKYVIDTSRNGNGPTGAGGEAAWCNPAGRAVGERFTTATGNENVDALLWVKVPGDSDGTCAGGPAAGQWWPERALELASGLDGAPAAASGGDAHELR